ncbi:acyltransferase family protein [Liquorilactobacillus capillatus]|uniref:Acyltransferase n=1 Tax=Liquorilactobacillus capillatus DSM 19910 TaxID=1423731 RepID=A0A0R1M561_9LACO|nr:acyltransferase family protein [Liquorilactobacillus capillatus]KRL03222.1 acyltransferase [Liquorilactobacillus capillatus DSM 19910]
MNRNLKKRRYINGFDGIRTLAVIGVILFHLMPYSIQGGYLGVPIFFVLSGYLITDLLNQEMQQNGRIDIISFYKRRIKRLYPGLVTMVLVTVSYITLFQRELLTNIRQVMVTNFIYVYNWFQVVHRESYFDRFGPQSPFTHLWSLSIEGQFYLFWPLLLILLWTLVRRKQPVFDIIFIAAFISALLMALLYKEGQDPSRVYYGTDTRMFSILLGASLSIVWPSTSLKKELTNMAKHTLNIVGIVSLILIIWMFFTMPGESSLTYHGGMFFFSLLAMIFIATVAHPGADMNRLMTNRYFSWLGKRSYGIYLYQYPVMIFYEAHVTNIAAHPWLHALIEIIIIVVISHLSYTYIERPLQHFDYAHFRDFVLEFFKQKSRYGWKRLWATGAVAVIFLTLIGAVQQPSATASKSDQQLQDALQANKEKVAKNNKKDIQTGEKSQALKQDKKTVATVQEKGKQTDSNTAAQTDGLSEAMAKKAQTLRVTAVGDSVLADGSVKLQSIFPQMYIDAKVGRQMQDAIAVLQSLANSGKLANIILLSIGTNGPFTDDQLDSVMSVVGKRKVYWINTHVPTRRWQGQVNDSLTAAAKKYPNLKVIDWYTYSQNHPDWFYDDNVHPNEYGLKYYSTYIAKDILK